MDADVAAYRLDDIDRCGWGREDSDRRSRHRHDRGPIPRRSPHGASWPRDRRRGGRSRRWPRCSQYSGRPVTDTLEACSRSWPPSTCCWSGQLRTRLGAVRPSWRRFSPAAPPSVVLATSRTPFGVPGERVRPIAPLPLPDPRVAAATDSPAVALFLDRARGVRPGLDAIRHQPGPDRRHLRPAGRTAAGHRAGRSPRPVGEPGRPRHTHDPSTRGAAGHRGVIHRPARHHAGRDRLVLPAAGAATATTVRTTQRFRGRLQPGRGRRWCAPNPIAPGATSSIF